jgi:hypothetical protein
VVASLLPKQVEIKEAPLTALATKNSPLSSLPPAQLSALLREAEAEKKLTERAATA